LFVCEYHLHYWSISLACAVHSACIPLPLPSGYQLHTWFLCGRGKFSHVASTHVCSSVLAHDMDTCFSIVFEQSYPSSPPSDEYFSSPMVRLNPFYSMGILSVFLSAFCF